MESFMIKKTIIILTIMTTMNGVMAQETTNSTGKWFIGAGSAIHNDKYSIGYKTSKIFS